MNQTTSSLTLTPEECALSAHQLYRRRARREIKPGSQIPVYETSDYTLVRWRRHPSGAIIILNRHPEGWRNLVALRIGSAYFDQRGVAWALALTLLLATLGSGMAHGSGGHHGGSGASSGHIDYHFPKPPHYNYHAFNPRSF